MRLCLPLLLLALISAACGRRDQYPDPPQITLKSVTLIPGNALVLDTLRFDIDFTDGNGDLGLNPEERVSTPTYMKYIGGDSNRINVRHYNYFPVLYIENPRIANRFDTIRPVNVYHVVKTSAGTDSLVQTPYIDQWGFYSAFRPTVDMNQGESIRGNIRFSSPGAVISPTLPPAGTIMLTAGRRWFVKLRIMDRAGNLSNIVYSDTVTYVP